MKKKYNIVLNSINKKNDLSKYIDIENISIKNDILQKPNWIKVKLPVKTKKIKKMQDILKKNKLNSVCEEAQCPNFFECFNKGTVTFMILGSICTRRCPFCAVKSGRPMLIDPNEAINLAHVIKQIKVNYVVLTSVARDDLHDGGSGHFSDCILQIRQINDIKIEILVPDFRNCQNIALKNIGQSLPDIFNHNLENVPRLYKQVRPGANYKSSLKLLFEFKKLYPNIKTKSGLMLGLGESNAEIIQVMKDLYSNGVDMLTIGQYLRPSRLHLPVIRYVSVSEFDEIKKEALSIGFTNVFCGPLVRSSYHAYEQTKIFNNDK
uniref:lipoyl synthase n=1 Tax=Buchnera aphidicola TaxID=9 RepID=UPI003F5CE980